jgi:threonylcarbamoyladenosine tRNA methylthiotransferase MtaB
MGSVPLSVVQDRDHETPTVSPIDFKIRPATEEPGEPARERTLGGRPKFGVMTLGCKVNQYESESYADQFWLLGFDVANPTEPLDVCIINSCSVTNMASAKSRQAIRKMRRRNPNVFLVATGCGTEADQGAVEGVEELDLVVPNMEKEELTDRVMDALVRSPRFPLPKTREREEAFRASDRTRALLKVQDGCDYFCSFCIIPYTRGPRKSRPWDRLLSEAELIARKGHKEVVITGICVGTYDSQEHGLHDLLRALSDVPGIERIRLSSIEPNDVNGPIAEELASNPKICSHFHIPLQSGDDTILRAMNRHYDTAQYLRTIRRLRETIPGVMFTTDLMVGFPGETDEHHANTMRFVEAVDFYKLHVFPYSVRFGTKAAEWPDQVPPEVKEERSKEFLAWSKASVEAKNRSMIGTTCRVIAEHRQPKPGWYSGLADTYLRVNFPSDQDRRGRIARVKITEAFADGVEGRLAD